VLVLDRAPSKSAEATSGEGSQAFSWVPPKFQFGFHRHGVGLHISIREIGRGLARFHSLKNKNLPQTAFVRIATTAAWTNCRGFPHSLQGRLLCRYQRKAPSLCSA